MSLAGLVAGELAEGAMPSADSLSVSDPLPGLLLNPQSDRRYLVRATPTVGTEPVSVDLTGGSASDRGYRSEPGDAVHKQFQPGLAAPYSYSVSIPRPNFMGLAPPGESGGPIIINNGNRAHDALTSYSWLGTTIETYLGPGAPKTALSLFTQIASCTTPGLQWDLDTIAILQKDKGFLLERELNERKYWGMGACLSFDGSGDYVDFGDVLDMGAANSFMIEGLFRSTSTGTSKTLASKMQTLSDSVPGVRLTIGPSNNFSMRVSDGINGVTKAVSALPYLTGDLFRYSLEINRSAQVMRLYVEGELIGTSGSISAVGSLANAHPLRVGAFADGSNGWIGDQDDFRFWSSTRSQNEIKRDMHRELSGAGSGLEIYTKFNEGAGSTASDETVNNRDGTITGATWVGSLEGDVSIAGKSKPRCFGVKPQIEPILVDPQRLVYQIEDGSMQAIPAVRDSGDPLTPGSDLSNIYLSVPVPGTFNTCLAKGLFRLGSSPVGAVTCDAEGSNDGSLGYVSSAAGIARKMAGVVLNDSTDIDLESVAEVEALNSAATGYYSGTSSVTISAAIDLKLKDIAAFGYVSRLGLLTLGIVRDPADQTSTFTLTTQTLRDPSRGGTFRREQAQTQVKEVIVGYRQYGKTLNDSEVAGSVSLANRQDFAQEFRTVNAVSSIAPDDGDVITLNTELYYPEDAQDLADFLLAIWEVERSLYFVSPDTGILNYDIGSYGTLVHDAYQLSAGRKFAVVGRTESAGTYGQPDDIVLAVLLREREYVVEGFVEAGFVGSEG